MGAMNLGDLIKQQAINALALLEKIRAEVVKQKQARRPTKSKKSELSAT